MQLNPAAFNAHLQSIGQDFLWRKSHSCPCVNPRSGAANQNCPNCKGKRFFWDAPKKANAGVASQKTQQQWAQMGLYVAGDAVLSVPENSPLYGIGQFDRVVMLNSTDPFSTIKVRGKDDQLTVTVETIARVFWLDQNSVVVEGPLPAVSADGVLSWVINGPPAGTQYTVEGTAFSEYFCFGPFSSDRNEHHGARLPKKSVLRKFDLFGR